jgi:hypothetical protein
MKNMQRKVVCLVQPQDLCRAEENRGKTRSTRPVAGPSGCLEPYGQQFDAQVQEA